MCLVRFISYCEERENGKLISCPAFSPSFSWPRFFPFGHGPVNQEAVQHYDDVISEMHANGIMPAVTVTQPLPPS